MYLKNCFLLLNVTGWSNSHENVQEKRDIKMFTKKIHEVNDCVLIIIR